MKIFIFLEIFNFLLMSAVNRLFHYMLSMPKTVYFNLRCLPFNIAKRLPIFIYYNVHLGELHKGIIKINAPVKCFMIKYGVGGVKGIDSHKSQLWIQKGTVTFKGTASFAEGCSIRNNGELVFGNNFGAGKNCFISCTKQVVFGDDILMAWNGSVRDSDGHTVLYEDIPQEPFKPVIIGNHVWLAAETHILKGVRIGDNCIVAYRSLVNKSFDESSILIGGSPAKKIKESVNWKI